MTVKTCDAHQKDYSVDNDQGDIEGIDGGGRVALQVGWLSLRSW